MNRGVPPTAANARTGEFTPPGVAAVARSNQDLDCSTAPLTSASLPKTPRHASAGQAGRDERRLLHRRVRTPSTACRAASTVSRAATAAQAKASPIQSPSYTRDTNSAPSLARIVIVPTALPQHHVTAQPDTTASTSSTAATTNRNGWCRRSWACRDEDEGVAETASVTAGSFSCPIP